MSFLSESWSDTTLSSLSMSPPSKTSTPKQGVQWTDAKHGSENGVKKKRVENDVKNRAENNDKNRVENDADTDIVSGTSSGRSLPSPPFEVVDFQPQKVQKTNANVEKAVQITAGKKKSPKSIKTVSPRKKPPMKEKKKTPESFMAKTKKKPVSTKKRVERQIKKIKKAIDKDTKRIKTKEKKLATLNKKLALKK